MCKNDGKCTENEFQISYRDPNVVALLWDIFILSWFDISEEDLRGRLEETSGVTGGAENNFISWNWKLSRKKKIVKSNVFLLITWWWRWARIRICHRNSICRILVKWIRRFGQFNYIDSARALFLDIFATGFSTSTFRRLHRLKNRIQK